MQKYTSFRGRGNVWPVNNSTAFFFPRASDRWNARTRGPWKEPSCATRASGGPLAERSGGAEQRECTAWGLPRWKWIGLSCCGRGKHGDGSTANQKTRESGALANTCDSMWGRGGPFPRSASRGYCGAWSVPGEWRKFRAKGNVLTWNWAKVTRIYLCGKKLANERCRRRFSNISDPDDPYPQNKFCYCTVQQR